MTSTLGTLSRALWTGALVFALPAGGLTAQDEEAVAEAASEVAQAAAVAWLEIVDTGEYEASWEAAASSFRAAVTSAAWLTSVSNARNPFGEFGERTLIQATYAVDPPNAPPGQYVVIQYRTAVSFGGHVTETVVPALDADGQWRVSGYFVAPGG